MTVLSNVNAFSTPIRENLLTSIQNQKNPDSSISEQEKRIKIGGIVSRSLYFLKENRETNLNMPENELKFNKLKNELKFNKLIAAYGKTTVTDINEQFSEYIYEKGKTFASTVFAQGISQHHDIFFDNLNVAEIEQYVEPEDLERPQVWENTKVIEKFIDNFFKDSK